MKTAIIAVSKKAIEQASKLKELYPPAQIYVPARFCSGPAFSAATTSQGLTPLSGSFSEAVAHLFESHRLLIFLTATAVAVRAIAPCLESKAKDPAVVVVDEQAKFAISLLSGHLGGANEETLKIARCLGAQPVITTATDNRGITAFDDLARRLGWQIENLPDLKHISAALLEEREIIFYSDHPFTFPLKGCIKIAENPEQLKDAYNGYVLVSSREVPLPVLPGYPHIILRPPVIAAGVGCRRGIPAEAIINAVENAFSEAGLSIASLACLASGEFKADEEGLIEAAKHFGVELKIFTREEISANLGDSQISDFVQDQVGVGAVAEPCARLGSNGGKLVLPTIRKNGITTALATTKRDKGTGEMTHIARKELINMLKGKVSVVGTGPGPVEFLTAQAAAAIEESDLVIGYKLYINQMASLLEGSEKEVISSAMGREVDRCRRAVAEAKKGRKVALISGGDPGIYGMAGLLLQVAQEEETPPEVEIIPGVTAAGAAAAVLGAPLTHDFAVISLSDLLTPWAVIEKRLRAAAEADFVIVIYNPRSHGRSNLLAQTREILLECRNQDTAVGMVRGAGRDGEKTWATTLGDFTCCIDEADMATLVIIGNSKTYWRDGKMITPRGYEL